MSIDGDTVVVTRKHGEGLAEESAKGGADAASDRRKKGASEHAFTARWETDPPAVPRLWSNLATSLLCCRG